MDLLATVHEEIKRDTLYSVGYKMHFKADKLVLADNGGTSGFQSGLEGIIPTTIRSLEPPIRVKMGTASSYAKRVGIRPFCQPSVRNNKEQLSFLQIMLIVDNFDPKLIIVSVPRLKEQGLHLHDPPLPNIPYLYRCNELESIPHDFSKLPENNRFMLMNRASNGLLFLPIVKYNEDTPHVYTDQSTNEVLCLKEAIKKFGY